MFGFTRLLPVLAGATIALAGCGSTDPVPAAPTSGEVAAVEFVAYDMGS